MARIALTELGRAIASKHGLTQREAERFISAFIDVVNDGLQHEKQLKIKGLGTFKVIDTKDRESVNINTGERILIGGRGKITFTPDAVMRELVNKPFAQFQTVVLNEGVSFDDVDIQEDTIDAENNNSEIPASNLISSLMASEQQAPSDENVTPVEEVTPLVVEETSTDVEEPSANVEEPSADVEEHTNVEEDHIDEEPTSSASSLVEFVDNDELVEQPSDKETVEQIKDKGMENNWEEQSHRHSHDGHEDHHRNHIYDERKDHHRHHSHDEHEEHHRSHSHDEDDENYRHHSHPKHAPHYHRSSMDNFDVMQYENMDPDEEGNKGSLGKFPWILLSLLLIAGGTYLGYYFGKSGSSEYVKALENEHAALLDTIAYIRGHINTDSLASIDKRESDSLLKAQAESVMNAEKRDIELAAKAKELAILQSKKNESIAAEHAKRAAERARIAQRTPVYVERHSQPVQTKTVTVQSKTAKAVASKDEKEASRYDAANAQVRLGAYSIVGYDQTVTVRKGQTLASISKAFFGPGMECYIQAYNNGIKEVQEGMKLKIPKLQLKKKLSKNQ